MVKLKKKKCDAGEIKTFFKKIEICFFKKKNKAWLELIMFFLGGALKAISLLVFC
jgi:hypothetical protein